MVDNVFDKKIITVIFTKSYISKPIFSNTCVIMVNKTPLSLDKH